MSTPRMPSSAVRPVKQIGGGCAALFGLPFIIAGIALGLFLYLPAISGWWSARGWEEVPCWIEKAELSITRGSKGGSTQKAEARYRYDYGGRSYQSEQVSAYTGSDNIGDFQERAYEQLRAHAGGGHPFRCYVNPQKPDEAVLFRELRWGYMMLMSIFPLLFPLVGGFVSLGGLWEARKAGIGRKLEAAHPGEPWRWRAEWAGETIQASQSGAPFILALAGWMLLVQGPLAAAVLASGEISREPLSALALLPSLLALIPLHVAWLRVKTRKVLGAPSLWLKRTPIRPGSALEGELRLGRVLSPRESIQARLVCQRKIIRRTSKGSSTSTETVWERSETLSAADARREITGVALPLRLEIPPGLPCAIVEDAAFITGGGEQHHWMLELRPGAGGSPVVLPLPVFLTGDEATTPAESDTTYEVEAIAPDNQQLIERLKSAGVTLDLDGEGLPARVICPPGRFRFMSLFLLIFGSVWSVIFLVLVAQGAPWIFSLVWGVTSPLILGMGLWHLLHHRRVEISAGELLILSRLGPFWSWRETYAPRHFIAFTHDSNMQSGGQFYYRVIGETTFGKKHTLIDGITDSVTAQTLANKLDAWRRKAQAG